MTTPTPDDAAVAVAEVAAARGAVGAATHRSLPVVLAATSVLTFLDFAVKDEIAGPRRRAAATVLIQTAIAGIGLLDARAGQVNPYAVATGPEPARGARLAAVGLGWYAAERLAVHLLRRSSLTRPNTVAGLLLAVTRPAGTLVTLRMLPRADGRA
ncbi:hypothetical protein AD006_08555 [Pseudonocardia sp. EC080610-09]|uniref:hypothetical protein n=1 Tax=Pseudonocardia sp. EC080610-09 TaxID=1688404 RepID=UPI000705BDBA|nr:hypothetical protein [Pseudonocardia sp. EC080610-09]ALL75338.1 hypothetical protein AD006_08555 [Pseudonocardia sp. EC080610-09]